MTGTTSGVTPAGLLDLGELLWPWSAAPLHAALGPARVEQVPPDVMWAALGTVDPGWSLLRHRGRPPARWLVDQAVRCDGVLMAQVDLARASLAVDGLEVPADRGPQVLAAIRRRWRDALDACEVTVLPGGDGAAVRLSWGLPA